MLHKEDIMKAIGLDIGTTSISTVVLDLESSKTVCSKTISNGSFIKTENSWERVQNVAVLTEKAIDVLDEMIDRYPDIAAIGLTGQMHGILYVDAEGNCLSPLYTWEDGRGDLPMEDCGESAVSYVSGRYGLPVASGYGLMTHLYHTRCHMVPEKAATFCTIADYIGMKITRRKKPLVNNTNAASFGMFDVKNGCFYKDIIAEAGMDPALLPETTAEVEVLGKYRYIPVVTARGDNQASFLGAAGMEEETWLLNVGTGGQLSVLSKVCFEAPGVEARPYLNGTYLLAGSALCSGRAYAILEHFFRSYAAALGQGDQAQYAVMEKLVKEVDPADCMHVVTKFGGTRIDPSVRGSISNISENNFTPGGLVYGTLRGISQELYDWYDIIHKGTGINVSRLLGSGNGVRKNAILRELFSEMFRCPLELSRYEEEAACGAASSYLYRKQ